MHSHVRKKKSVVFFAPDVSDVSTVKRAEAFLAHGYQLQVFGFRRENYNRGYEPSWPYVNLGRTYDFRYLQRFTALLGAFPRILAQYRKLRTAEVLYARNLDQLLLAIFARLFARQPARLIYEILDIQPAFVGGGWRARLLRAIERFGLRRTDLLVVSSPGFLRHYFKPIQNYGGAWFLLENKLPANFPFVTGIRPAEKRGMPGREGYRWVVGYCGLIRGRETIDLIIRLAERLQGLVLFRFRGIFTTVDRRYLMDAVARLDNLVYDGDYVNPRDLPAVYGDIDFAWAIDLEHTEHNSRWLLPCRFYEAGYFGVPCLTARGFEVARLVEEAKVGWSFEEPYEDALVRFFLTVTQTEYDDTRQRLLDTPSSGFVAGEDTIELLQKIDRVEYQAAAE